MISNYYEATFRVQPSQIARSQEIVNDGNFKAVNRRERHFVINQQLKMQNGLDLQKFSYISVRKVSFINLVYNIEEDFFLRLVINGQFVDVFFQRGHYTADDLISNFNDVRNSRNLYRAEIANPPTFKITIAPTNPAHRISVDGFYQTFYRQNVLGYYELTFIDTERVSNVVDSMFFGNLIEDHNSTQYFLESSFDINLSYFDQFLIKTSNTINVHQVQENDNNVLHSDNLSLVPYGSHYSFYQGDILQNRHLLGKTHVFNLRVTDNDDQLLKFQTDAPMAAYNDATTYIFSVHQNKANPFGTIQLNPGFNPLKGDIRPFIGSNWSGPGTQVVKNNKLENFKPTTNQDLIAKEHDLEYTASSLSGNDKLVRKADDEMVQHLEHGLKQDFLPHGSVWEGIKRFASHPWQQTADIVNNTTHLIAIKGKEVLEDTGLIKQYGYEHMHPNPKLLAQTRKRIEETHKLLTQRGY